MPRPSELTRKYRTDGPSILRRAYANSCLSPNRPLKSVRKGLCIYYFREFMGVME